MIVWTGRGILSLLVFFVVTGILIVNLPAQVADYGFAVGAFSAGAFSWFMGNKWNSGGETFIHKETGEEIEVSPNHSLFWIPMQYWGFIFGIIGIVILVQNLFK